jgi:curli biogenesis system outer membrane secretion channel CsgG
VLIFGLSISTFAQRSYSVAVLPFEAAGNLHLSWNQKDELLDGITQMITDRLANQPDLILIERRRIKDLLTEQQFQQSGVVDLSSAVQIGRLLGVDILLLGTLNDFSLTSRSGIGFGPLQVSGTTAKTVISARLVGVEKGQILGSIEAEGKETSLDIAVDKLQGLSFGSQQFKESIVGKALNKAIDNFSEQFNESLINAKDKLVNSGGLKGKVIAIKGNYIIVNLGSKDGITSTTKLSVFRLENIEGLIDPVRLPNGSLQIVSVDENAAVTKILTTVDGLSIQVGDLVEVEN